MCRRMLDVSGRMLDVSEDAGCASRLIPYFKKCCQQSQYALGISLLFNQRTNHVLKFLSKSHIIKLLRYIESSLMQLIIFNPKCGTCINQTFELLQNPNLHVRCFFELFLYDDRVHIFLEMKQGQCVKLSTHSAGAFTATLLVMGNVMREGGRSPPPPSPARANFTLMTECTPESSGCYSVFTTKKYVFYFIFSYVFLSTNSADKTFIVLIIFLFPNLDLPPRGPRVGEAASVAGEVLSLFSNGSTRISGMYCTVHICTQYM